MADLTDIQSSATVRLVGNDELYAAGVDSLGRLKVVNVDGKTRQYVGTTASTADFNIPSSPLGQLERFSIECRGSSPGGATLGISLDGGTTFWTIEAGVAWSWDPKKDASGTAIQQAVLRPSVAGLLYQAVVNYEP